MYFAAKGRAKGGPGALSDAAAFWRRRRQGGLLLRLRAPAARAYFTGASPGAAPNRDAAHQQLVQGSRKIRCGVAVCSPQVREQIGGAA